VFFFFFLKCGPCQAFTDHFDEKQWLVDEQKTAVHCRPIDCNERG